MRAFWALAVLRALDTLRSRSSAAFVLVFPVLLLAVVGYVFRDGHPFERRTVLVVEGAGDTALLSRLGPLEELRVERVATHAEALGRLRTRMVSAVLEPSGRGRPPRLLVGARDRVFARGLLAWLPAGTATVRVSAPRWGYVHYLFPGVLGFSVMLSGLFATGYTMVSYRQNRFLKKLATTPISRTTFVLAQVAGRSVLVAGQIVLVIAAGVLFFDVPLTLAAALEVLGLALAALLAFMGIGFVLACLIRTEDLVIDLINAVNLPLVFLSEVFFPLSALPRPLALVGELLPSTVMIRLVRAVLLHGGADPASLGWGLALILGWAALAFALSLRLFRWHA